MEIIEPVMPAPASEARSEATMATSSTSFTRFVADSLVNHVIRSSYAMPIDSAALAPSMRIMSVSIAPGHRAFTVMPIVPTSWASAFVSPLTACLPTTYCEMPGLPTLPSTDEMLMIRPHCCGIMCFNAARLHQKVLQKFTVSPYSIASSVRSTTGALSFEPPALFTRMSMRP